MSTKTTTNLRLDPMTLGYLRYFLKHGEFATLYDGIDVLVAAFAEHYAELNEIDLSILNKEAHDLYIESTRPQTTKSKKEQQNSARNAMRKMGTNKRRSNDLVPKDTEIKVGGIFGEK